jgi:2-aminobenzoylacetyl-CoA thioesterase
MNINQSKDNSFPRLLTDNLWAVGNYYFNLYVLRGEQASAIVEAGVSGVVDQVIGQLRELKIHPSFVVVTHPHADHVTGLSGLQGAFPDALVVTGEGATEFLAHPKTANLMAMEDLQMSKFLAAHGHTPGRAPVPEPPSLQNVLVAKNGDKMDLGGITMSFLSAEGHSPGTIVVHVPELSAVMLSDSLGFRFPGRGIMPLFFTSYAGYMETLDRLHNLDARIGGVAHQGPLIGQEVKDAFEEARSTAIKLRDEIVEDCREPEVLVKDLFERYYKDELTMYSPDNILTCMRLVVKRAKESVR